MAGPQPEAGLNAFSTYISVAPGSSTVLKVELTGRLQPHLDFASTVRLQPLANPVSASVTLDTGGGRPASTWTPGPEAVQSHRWAGAGKT
jgi:hypothetical protein